MFDIGVLVQDRYRIASLIGQGGMALVYRAEDIKLGRQVAIKLLKDDTGDDPEALNRFISEARAAAALSHPNIVTVYDVVNQEDIHYIVMELVEGITLKNYILKKGHLECAEAINIAIQAAMGLGEAHRHGIIHRDVKSQNIIVDEKGRVKVTDFGIALAKENDDGYADDVIGSAHYIAPEQAEKGFADERSDLYSLGICIYEMVTGRLPFDADESVEIVKAHINNALVPPIVYNPEIYPALNDIVIKAVTKEPDYRYQNADELIADLKLALKEPKSHFVRFYASSASNAQKVLEADKGRDTLEASDSHERSKNENSKDGSSASILEIPDDLESPSGSGEQMSMVDGGENGKTKEGSRDSVAPAGETKALENFLSQYRLPIVLICVAVFALILIAAVVGFGVLRQGRSLSSGNTQDGNESSFALGDVPGSSSDSGEVDITIVAENLMPNVLGQSLSEAQSAIYELGASVDSSSTTFSDTYQSGTVAAQSPTAGTHLSSEEVVHLTVSLGSERDYILQNIAGTTLEEAESEVERVGINYAGYREEFSETVDEGIVIGYESAEATASTVAATMGEETAALNIDGYSPIRLIVSLGSQSDYTQMPDVTGRSFEEARTILEGVGLSLGTLTVQNTDAMPRGIVISQSISGETPVKLSSLVDLVLSVGTDSGYADGTVVTEDLFDDEDNTTISETGVISADYYYGAINTVCTVSDDEVESGGIINVGVRLSQTIDGATEYTQIEEPVPLANGSEFPVYFPNIRGTYGVENGVLEIYNADNNKVYANYTISFSAR